MTEVLRSPSSSSSSSLPTPTHNTNTNDPLLQFVNEEQEEGISDGQVKDRDKGDRDQLSLLALLLTLFRKSFWVACKAEEGGNSNSRQELSGMEIGWPTNVRHVAHVTFDRFNGFLGLPVEFEPEVPTRAPSASATVFGVSTESMQLSYDIRGNSIPTILLLMQRRLYSQGGLQAEGIFRINAENSQEEHVRNQLNRGVVPDDIDMHCLAGLIKAWFRELPSGVLDPLSPEQVMQCQSEDDASSLVRLLPPTESALLDWAINLMVDVVQQEHVNKMNAHNIAMVFAPNMTQMADPLTALMYAVQVMNFLKTLITKTLREREDSVIEPASGSHLEPSDENGHQGPSHSCLKDYPAEEKEEREREQTFTVGDPPVYSDSECNQAGDITDEDYVSYSSATEDSDGGTPTQIHSVRNGTEVTLVTNLAKNWVEEKKVGQSSEKINGPQQLLVQALDKSMGISNLSRINSETERVEAWR